MKTIQVVAAIIRDGDKILATQRGYGEFAGGWEFPGGKVEQGESDEVALVREIKEELEVDIVVEEFVHTVEYDYPNFHLSMNCYFAKVVGGEIVLTEHQSARWLTQDTLMSVEWLPADVSLIELLKELMLHFTPTQITPLICVERTITRAN
ncbi:MAG: (deoxy)nucleoside triphosphate pyrophosphohydrolase [Eubacteriales bacterium]